jgi:hypothetical protein
MNMGLQTKDIDKLLEATVDIEDTDCCFMLLEIDIDQLLDRTQDW